MERIRGPECTRLADLTADSRAAKLFPEEIARKYACVPLRIVGNQVEIACLDPNNREMLLQVAAAICRPVVAKRTSLHDLRQAIERVYHSQNTLFQTPNTSGLLNRLGHLPVRPGDQDNRSLAETPLKQARALIDQSNDQLEASGISSYLPHFRKSNLTPDPDLSVLIPEPSARLLKIVPLSWVKEFLIAGIIPGKQTSSIIHIKELPGIPILTIACTQEIWEDLYRQVYLRGPQPQAEDTPQVMSLLVKRGLLTEMDLNSVRGISRGTSRSLGSICIDRGLITQEQLLQAQAQVVGVPYEAPDHKNGNGRDPAGDILPARLAKAFYAVALGIEDKKLVLGIGRYDRRIIRLAERVTGMQVEARFIDITRQEEYLINPPVMQPESGLVTCSLDEMLLGIGLVTRDQLLEAQKHEPAFDESFEERLLRLGLLDENDLAEALSGLTGIPNTSLRKAVFDKETTDKLPASLATKEMILPLEACGDDLWVAVADPLNGSGLRAAEEASKMRIWPVIAPRSAIRAAIQQVYGIQIRDFPPELNKFVTSLVRREYINQVEAAYIIDQYSTHGLPIDLAVIKATRLDDKKVCGLLSEHFHFSQTSLSIQEQTYDVIDALGALVTRQRAVDSVDHEIARLISLETSQRLRALPFHRTDGRVQIAFAAPPSETTILELESKISEKVDVLLAPANDLAEAIERVLGKQNLGTRMLLAGAINRHQLNDALDVSRRTGVRIGHSLVNRGYIKQEQLYHFLSEQSGLPLQKIDPGSLQPEVVRLLDADSVRKLGVLPIDATDNSLTLAVTDPFNSEGVETAEKITGKAVKTVLVTEHNLEEALEAIYSQEYLSRSISELLERSPKDSAYKVLNTGQIITLIIIAAVSLLWMILHTTSFFIITNILATIFYLSFSAYKFYLVYKSMTNELEVPVSQQDLDELEETELPVYTILVPVYKEANVLPSLLAALEDLDYPSTKLDIKVLLEEDDEETIRAFYKIDPPSQFQPVIVPYGLPKTKPKACNYGLIHARGDYIVIFDAEDLPERDQLKRVLVAFNKSAPEVVCIQSKLNYYNRNQNMLTRWFTVEYSMWFDLFLPGLDAAHAPIPLGGTSNHFKRDALIDAGAWDPYNVTEDADLGIRMFKRGYRTAIVDSTTYEEANSQMRNWLRQRSRWIKGYIQTWLVHMRNPIRLWKEIGTSAFFSFQFVVGGTFFAALANPIYWLLTTLWFLTRWDLIPKMFPGPIFFVGAVCLYIGNFAFAYMNVAGAMRRGYYDMVKYALLSPLYWGLMSIGAWRGFGQLLVKPHFWEKTIHGLTPMEENGQTGPQEPSTEPTDGNGSLTER